MIGHKITKLTNVKLQYVNVSRSKLINGSKEVKSKVEETIKKRGLEVNFIVTLKLEINLLLFPYCDIVSL